MRKFLLLACPLLLTVSGLRASSVSCTAGTMANYLALSSGCMVGNLLFSNFSLTESGNAQLPTASSIGVDVVNQNGSGLQFNGPFATSMGQAMDVGILFTVTASTPVITGDTLSMAGFGTQGTGNVAVAESLCAGGTYSANLVCSAGNSNVASMLVFQNSSASVSSDSVTFAAPVATVGAAKNIILENGAGATSASAVSFVVNTFTSGGGSGGGQGGPGTVPEPASYLTLGSGLLFTGLLLRRKLRKI